MCAFTEPVRTGIGVVCVEEYGRPKWPITMLNHTNKQTSLVQNNVWFFYFWHPMLVRPVMKRLFSLGKPRKKRLASLARLIIISILQLLVHESQYAVHFAIAVCSVLPPFMHGTEYAVLSELGFF